MTPRETVWLALSDLFLDTDVSLFSDNITVLLQEAPFDLATLDRIFIDEVYPVCVPNLQKIVGEWAAFHDQWLFDSIAAEREKWRPLLHLQRQHHLRTARKLVPEWFTIRAALVAQGKS